MFTIPMGESGGRAKFVWMKGGEDGNGFEEWYVDDQWFYLRLDTTWAYERNGEFCDTQCGNSNEYPCRRRWAGEEGDFAYTVYHDPASGSEPARWLPRRLDLAMDGGWVPYASEMGIKAERFSDCSECTNDFTSPHVGRSGEARRHSSWGGFSDVVELHITAGPGAGEHYYYARGRGWVGFGVDGGETTGADATAPQSSKFPNMACGNGYATASVCGVAG